MNIAAVLFDRDGTLVEDVPYNGDPDKVVPRRGVVAAVAAMRARRFRTGVVTNQSGIGRGMLRRDEVDGVNRRVDELIGPFDFWGICPHGPEAGCACRKPAPGLIITAMTRFGVAPQEVVVVGDRLGDLAAANAAGAVAALVRSPQTEPGAEHETDLVLATMDDLVGCVDALLGRRP